MDLILSFNTILDFPVISPSMTVVSMEYPSWGKPTSIIVSPDCSLIDLIGNWSAMLCAQHSQRLFWPKLSTWISWSSTAPGFIIYYFEYPVELIFVWWGENLLKVFLLRMYFSRQFISFCYSNYEILLSIDEYSHKLYKMVHVTDFIRFILFLTKNSPLIIITLFMFFQSFLFWVLLFIVWSQK